MRRTMPRKLGPILVGLAILLAAGLLFHRFRRPTGAPPPSVLLISIDTLRSDHLGAYGYFRDTSPEIDRFAGDAVLFESAAAQAPSTLPSHASLFSSMVPQHHGASLNRQRPLAPEVVTLAEVFRDAGYATAGFHDGGQMAPIFGLGQGFERYRVVREPGFRQTVHRARAWLERVRRRPFFLFLHTYEVHHPYTPRPDLLKAFAGDYSGPLPSEISIDLLRQINRHELPVNEADRQFIVAAYDAEIRSVDEAFASLLRFLEERRLYDRLLIVLLSDHGEEFGEHGRMGWHSHSLYEELLRIPLIIKLPRNAHAGLRVPALVREIDVAPTLLDLAGLPPVPQFEGSSLRPLLKNPVPDAAARPSIALRPGQRPTESVRLGRWKLYKGRLYDLAADPGETTDVANAHPQVVAALRRVLEEVRQSGPSADQTTTPIDEATREQLKSLGYLD